MRFLLSVAIVTFCVAIRSNSALSFEPVYILTDPDFGTIEEVPSDLSALSPRWRRSSNGDLAFRALEGAGNDAGVPLFVGRALFGKKLIPGKIDTRRRLCYVADGGDEREQSKYEVLCGCNAVWLKTSGREIPRGAIVGGNTENGETLFIGRAHVNKNALIIGKVQPSREALLISYDDREIAYSEYEILVFAEAYEY